MKMKIALLGNPNCGKTTMFNAVTGSTQYVGNWPGVTVEKRGPIRGHKDLCWSTCPAYTHFLLTPLKRGSLAVISPMTNRTR